MLPSKEKKEELQAHLKDCILKFNSLKKCGYTPPMTNDSLEGEYDATASESPEFEYGDAYADPVEAIRLFVEILQTRGELGGEPRTKIISMEKAKEIMSRLPNKQYPLLKNGLINAEIFSTHGNKLIVPPIAKPDTVVLDVV